MIKFIYNAYLATRCRHLTLEEFLIAQKLLAMQIKYEDTEFYDCCPNLASQARSLDKVQTQKLQSRLLKSLESGVLLTYPGHELYPQQFLNLNPVPFLIRFIGSPIWLTQKGLAVVGSRDPSSASLSWMENSLASILNQNLSYIVSGGARGVDQKAHSLAIRSQVPTVALLPSGLKNIYPKNLVDWVEPITESGGALMSEYEDDEFMQKYFFQERNRLIAALGVCTLIVEARKKSGTMITALQTMEQGKPVLVLPGHPYDMNSNGGLDLICDGAIPIRNGEDLKSHVAAEVSKL